MNRCTPDNPKFTGVRFAVYPMHDDFASTILNAVEQSNPNDLYIHVDDLGTTAQGSTKRVFAYAAEVFLRAASAADHVTAVMQFSSGGEPVATDPEEGRSAVPMPETNFTVSANWALYPLGAASYSDVLTEAIDGAIAASFAQSTVSCYASRLDGRGEHVFETIRTAFESLRDNVPHTVVHVTLSKGSPSKPKSAIDVYGGDRQ